MINMFIILAVQVVPPKGHDINYIALAGALHAIGRGSSERDREMER